MGLIIFLILAGVFVVYAPIWVTILVAMWVLCVAFKD